MHDNPSRDELRTRWLEVARAREGNVAAIAHVSQQLLEIRARIRRDLETPWLEEQGSIADLQARVKCLSELIVQDVSTQEELGSQVEAGLAITATLRSVLMDMGRQGLDVSDLLTRLDQILPREA